VSQFWQFTVSGIVVAWVPMFIGFAVHHWRIRLYIDRRTAAQTRVIRQLTELQTGDIRQLTEAQTRELAADERRRRLRRRTRA
jgi:hypothetical protein